MPASISLTESDLLTALGNLLVAILPTGTGIIIGQENRVSEPRAVNYVVMTPLFRNRISTNVNTATDNFPAAPGTIAALQSTMVTVQLDAHGPAGTDNAQIISTLFRDEYACDFLAAQNASIQPLYTSDPKQMPFINGEAQYEDRWTVDVMLQANITVTTGQDFSGALHATVISASAAYPV